MTPLQKQLVERIQREGPISLAQFMATALYDPTLGYYSSGRAKIGKKGDFYTSVSVGPLFGKLLARQFSQMWNLLGKPSEWTLLEQGAFDGRLAEDVLDALREQSPDCYEATKMLLVEPFARFEAAQRTTLESHSAKTHWTRALAACTPFTGVHYSNELLDAFPAHQVRWTNGKWVELRVGISGENFSWVETEIDDPEVARAAKRLSITQEGGLREVCPLHADWIKELSLKLQRGWIVVCDYGMSEEELALPHRSGGTLTGYSNHQRSACPLQDPGTQDITYQVNLSEIIYLSKQRDLQTVTLTEQRRFLTGIAPLHFRDSSTPLNKQQQKEALAFRSLTHPDLLGSRFKTLILSKNCFTSETIAGARFETSHSTTSV